MKLFKIEIPKSKLSLMPENEKIFFIQVGNLLNDLSMLQKLMYFSANTKTANNVVRAAQNSQALSLVRIQAGKLSEGWQMLQKDFFGTKVSQVYEKEFTDVGKDNLEKLKRYFSKKNLISTIRNEYSFHYPSSDQIIKLIDEAPDSEIFKVFMAEEHGNCHYSISNVLLNFAILKTTGISNTQKAMGRFLQDVIQVTRWFGDFLGDCLLIIANKHLGLKSYDVDIPDPPDINEVTLPYFVKGKTA